MKKFKQMLVFINILLFINVEVDTEQTLKEAYDKAVNDIEKYDGISNLCESSEEEFEIDYFKKSKYNIDKFHENLFPKANIGQKKNIISLPEQFYMQKGFIELMRKKHL